MPRSIVLAIILTILFLAPGLAATQPQPAVVHRPNVLVFVTDDMRALDTLEFMPKTRKWFADGGESFTEAYTAAAICCPARSAIWTGKYVHNTHVFTTADAAAIDENAATQAYLKHAGYKTAIFGKFFNSYPLTRNPINLDDWAFEQSGYTNVSYNDHGVRRTVAYSPRFIEARAQGFIADTNPGEPWYVMLTPYAPHSPWIPEPQYKDVQFPEWAGNPATLEVDRSDKPQHMQALVPDLGGKAGVPFDDIPEADGTLLQVNSNVPFDRQLYLRTLLTVDDMVDDIMTQVQAMGELDDTVAIFTSDQGLSWGEHAWYNKMVPYTPVVKIPMFVRYPNGGVPAGATSDKLVSGGDMLPTILQFAGVPLDPSKQHDMHSMFDTTHDRDHVLIEYNNQNLPQTNPVPTWASIRSRDYQYVEYYDASGAMTFQELYDLHKDPWQLDNRFRMANLVDPVSAADAQRLHDVLAHDRACSGTSGPLACP